jgi:hypothetical protein
MSFHIPYAFLKAGQSSYPFGIGNLNTTTSGIVNTYSYITDGETTSTNTGGDTTIRVEDGSQFVVGQPVMLYKTTHIDTASSAGRYEFNYVAGVNGNTITLEQPITTGFNSGNGSCQLVGAAVYNNLTLNGPIIAQPWNGKTGGILWVMVDGTLQCNNNYLSVFGAGYRGGTEFSAGADSGDSSIGNSGETWRGFDPSPVTDQNGITGLMATNFTGGTGIGGASRGGDAGGGGGHATSGGAGTADNIGDVPGGGTIGLQSMIGNMYFGGGGGRGGDNDGREYNQYADLTGTTLFMPNVASTASYQDPWIPDGTNLFPTLWNTKIKAINPGFNTLFGDSPLHTQDSTTNGLTYTYGSGGGLAIIWARNAPDLRVSARGVPQISTQTGGGQGDGGGASGSVWIKSEVLTVSEVDVRGQPNVTMRGDQHGGGGAGRIRLDLIGSTTYSGGSSKMLTSDPKGGAGTLQVNSNYTITDERTQ